MHRFAEHTCVIGVADCLPAKVQMFQTFVVGIGAQDADESGDSDDDVEEWSATKPATPGKNPKPAAVKSPIQKAKGPQSDRKSGGKALGPFHSPVQQAKSTASKSKNK